MTADEQVSERDGTSDAAVDRMVAAVDGGWRVREAAAIDDTGLAVETREGYGPDDRRTVFVARS